MRTLHVLGLSPDGRRLQLSTSAAGKTGYEVPVDALLTRALRGEVVGGHEVQAGLTPKQIQARLREGATVEQVAVEAGVPPARVERYAGPVLSEREQLLDRVRATRMTRPRGGVSGAPLGQAVLDNLDATAYVRLDTVAWSAYRRADGRWAARLEVVVRGRRRTAEWVAAGVRGQVHAADAYAASLGWVDPAGTSASPRRAPAAKAAKGAAPAPSAPTKGAKATRPAAAAQVAGTTRRTGSGSRARGWR